MTPTRVLTPIAFIFPLLVSGTVLSAGPAEAPRVIEADLGRAAGPFNRMGDLCVGAGRANEGLRADWQQQLAEVHRECGFRYVRFHGLLCDDMGVYQVDAKGREHYNWQYVDALFDALLGLGVRPFVELGFMPSALASGSHTIFWWRGNVTPPKDMAKWAALIRASVAHWTERYGQDEVRRWYFEVWNEPNLAGFWIGDQGGRTGAAWDGYARTEYLKLYASTAAAIKSVCPDYRVGGPATAGNAWVPETIAFCAAQHVPIDFISTHHYAVTAGYLDETGNAGTVLAPDRRAMISQVLNSRAQIAASAMPGLELHYTEWSTAYTPTDPVHDSYDSAAFILNKLKGVGRAAQSMSYWTFTDIFEEAGPRATPFHGGFGLLNYQDIRKPAFFAYQFLHRLGDLELATRDPDAFVCADATGSVQALFWDFTITSPGPQVIDQDFYNRDRPAAPVPPVALKLRGLTPGAYHLDAYKVGYRSNDAYTAYLDLGAPAQLTRGNVAKLKAAANGAPFATAVVQVGVEGTFEKEFAMRQNDVVLLTLRRVAAP
jgi:xylan 1,4-beta-xylosidase